MSDRPRVILSAFADEAANHKSALEQLSVMAAVGLRYYSPRFIDVTGSGEVKHVVELDDAGLAVYIRLPIHDEVLCEVPADQVDEIATAIAETVLGDHHKAKKTATVKLDKGNVVLFQGDSITDAGRDKKNQVANEHKAFGRGSSGNTRCFNGFEGFWLRDVA